LIKNGNSWDFEVTVAVRNGPWEYLPTQEKLPLPESASNNVAALSSSRPFAIQAAVSAPAVKEQIRYIGYFSGDKAPVVIIEAAGRFAVLKCGDTTPGGTVVIPATADELQLVSKDRR